MLMVSIIKEIIISRSFYCLKKYCNFITGRETFTDNVDTRTDGYFFQLGTYHRPFLHQHMKGMPHSQSTGNDANACVTSRTNFFKPKLAISLCFQCFSFFLFHFTSLSLSSHFFQLLAFVSSPSFLCFCFAISSSSFFFAPSLVAVQ